MATKKQLSNVLDADGSLATNPAAPSAGAPYTVRVGTLASDAQHGARGGGTQHAAATSGAAGFMSAADKAALDTVVGRSFLMAEMAAQQTTDLVAGTDHIKLDTTNFVRGSNITLQTAAYPALGRISLVQGFVYRMIGAVPYGEFSADVAALNAAWFRVDTGARLGPDGRITSATLPTRRGASFPVLGVLDLTAAGGAVLVEMRITLTAAVSAIGLAGDPAFGPSCQIEQL